MNDKVLGNILKRILWLKQKETEQRRVGSPEFTSSDLLRGRTQGEIGALKRLLRECDSEIEKDSGHEAMIERALHP